MSEIWSVVPAGVDREGSGCYVDVSKFPPAERRHVWEQLQAHEPELAGMVERMSTAFGRPRLLIHPDTLARLTEGAA